MLHRHHFSAESTFKCFILRKLFCSLCWMRKGLSSFACLEETVERNALCKLQSTEHSVAASAVASGNLGTPGGETQPTPEARPEAKCRESRGGEGELQKERKGGQLSRYVNSTLPLQLLASDSMIHPLPLINIRITQGQCPLLTAQAAQWQQHRGSQRSSPSLGVLNEAR